MKRAIKPSIKTLALKLHAAGLVAYIAGGGHYGFFTDETGRRVVCFEDNRLEGLKFSGNYRGIQSHDSNGRSLHLGTGWGLEAHNPYDLIEAEFRCLLHAIAPHWAIGDNEVRYVNLKEHLDSYQRSSHYTKFVPTSVDLYIAKHGGV